MILIIASVPIRHLPTTRAYKVLKQPQMLFSLWNPVTPVTNHCSLSIHALLVTLMPFIATLAMANFGSVVVLQWKKRKFGTKSKHVALIHWQPF